MACSHCQLGACADWHSLYRRIPSHLAAFWVNRCIALRAGQVLIRGLGQANLKVYHLAKATSAFHALKTRPSAVSTLEYYATVERLRVSAFSMLPLRLDTKACAQCRQQSWCFAPSGSDGNRDKGYRGKHGSPRAPCRGVAARSPSQSVKLDRCCRFAWSSLRLAKGIGSPRAKFQFGAVGASRQRQVGSPPPKPEAKLCA